MMRANERLGFTLLELVVVMAVLGILAAAISPSVMQRIVEGRIEATEAEARVLHEAMVGAPGTDAFGFVGDIGRLPATFQELVQPGGLPAYHSGTVRSVGMGWRGPYVNAGTSPDDFLTDAFGRAYAGASSGQVRSAGPDGALNTGDDIVYPPSTPPIAGDVVVTVRMAGAPSGGGNGNGGNGNGSGGSGGATITVVDPIGYRVDLYYSSNGAEAVLSDTAAPFSFSNVPVGVHAVRVVKTANPQAGTIAAQDTIVVRPRSTTAAELWF